MPQKPIAQLGREVIDARDEYEKQHRIKVKAEEKKQALEDELMTRMRNEQPPKDLGEGYGKVTFTPMKTIRGRVFDIDAARPALEAVAGDNPEGYLETKPRQKPINDLVRTCLENGQPIPDGIEFTEQPYIRITRRKK